MKILAQTIRTQNCFKITVHSAVHQAMDEYEHYLTFYKFSRYTFHVMIATLF